MSLPSVIKPGQVWKELDPRLDRHVLVLEIVKIDGVGDRIRIIRCNRAGVAERGMAVRSAKPSRFNGKRGGYQFVGTAVHQGDEDGPGEEDGPWAAGWAERSGQAPAGDGQGGGQ